MVTHVSAPTAKPRLSVPVFATGRASLVQRKCACGGPAGLMDECERCREERPTLLRRPTDPAATPEAPPIVNEVLRSPGRPLDPAARTFLASRFGHQIGRLPLHVADPVQAAPADLTVGPASHPHEREAETLAEAVMSEPGGAGEIVTGTGLVAGFDGVRVHNGPRAAESARALNARAYTVGRHVVFGEGQYAPGTTEGRRLLAHELAHVLQQSGATRAAPPVPGVIRCACVPNVPCPPLNLELGAVFPRWEAAEKCLQEDYRRNHPANVIGFNKEWLYITGRRPPEQQDIDCFKPHYVAASGMYSAEPDIFDFTATSIHEVTTPAVVPKRVGKLAAEVLLANRLAKDTSMGCSGRSWFPGTWPPSPCYWLGGDLYMRAWNSGGFLLYQLLKDVAKEAVTAAAMAALLAALKKGGPTAAAKTAGRKFVPIYATAGLIATAIALASGKAEAKVGPGDDEPITAMFKALSAKGTPMPPELQGALQTYMDANPDAKAKIEDAMRKGGDVTAAQEELNRQAVQLISENPGEFSEEDLATLLTATESAPAGTKGSDVTVDAIQKAIADHRAGRSPASSGTGKSEGGGTGKSEGGGTGKSEGGPAPAAPADKYAGLSPSARARLGGAPPLARRLFDAIAGPSGTGPKIDDQAVDRFLGIVQQAGLTAPQVNEIIARLGPATATDMDQLLGQLEAAVKEISAGAKKAEALANDPAAGLGSTTETPDIGKIVDSVDLMVAARQADVSALSPGESYFPLPDPLKVGAERDVRHIAKIAGAAVGNAHIRIVSFTDTTVSVLFALSTDMYDGQGKVVLSASALVGNVVTARRAGGKKSK